MSACRFDTCPFDTCQGPLVRPAYASESVACWCLFARTYPESMAVITGSACSGVAAGPNTDRTDAQAVSSASCVSIELATAPDGGLSPRCSSASLRSNGLSIAIPPGLAIRIVLGGSS